MFWTHVELMWPALATHWFFSCVFALFGWWAWAKFHPRFKFQWIPPVLVGTLFSWTMALNNATTLWQGQRFSAFNAQLETQNRQVNQEQYNQLKGSFLKSVDALTQNPNLFSEQSKAQLFQQHAALFPNGVKDLEIYRSQVLAVYECQKHFLKDLKTTFTQKKVTKSPEREVCEKAPGNFFNREKLITENMVKSNEEALQNAATKGRLPAADGKEVTLNVKDIDASIAVQDQAINVIKKLFE